jgi:hypothetical protein
MSTAKNLPSSATHHSEIKGASEYTNTGESTKKASENWSSLGE